MIDLITKFAEICRSADLRVSAAEIIDCTGELAHIDVSDEAQFKTVLRANFAKSRRDQRTFDRLYHLFFHEMHPELPDNPAEPQSEAEHRLFEQLRADADGDALDQSISDFLAGDPAGFLRTVQNLENRDESPAPNGTRTNLGQMASRMEMMLRLNARRAQIARLTQNAHLNGDAAEGRAAARQIEQRIERARRMLTEETRPYHDGLRQVRAHQRHFENLGERPFSSLTPREIEEMREVIEQLVRKLKDRMGRRYAAASRGTLDVKGTLRNAGKFQGVPLVIKYRRRPLRKTRIVTLCDVSGSVWSAARFMLNMLYSLQDCFSAVHSFAFVCGTTDITEIFENNEVNQAVEKVLSSADIDFGALTDYGAVFSEFRRNFMHLVNRKTTVIIMGDARTNYHNPREAILDEIREKSRRLIWLNPEPEAFWTTGDSEMNTYKAYCHEVRPCRNLNQLIDFIEELTL